MKKPTAIALSGLAIVGLGIGVQRFLFEEADQTFRSEKHSPPAVPRLGRLEAASSSGAQLLPRLESSAKPSVPQQNPVKEAEEAAPVDANAIDPNAVIGLPFPLSASVRDQCARLRLPSCKSGYNGLAQMEQEPRDLAWAPMMEAKIAASIAAEPSHPSIRTIECRQTICAYETATINGSYTGPSYEFESANHVLTNSFERGIGSWMYGLETDPSGAPITVRVGFLVRQ